MFRIAILVCSAINIACVLRQVTGGAIAKAYNETCESTVQCSDHRYACVPDENNVTRCFCDRFHKWLGHQKGCVQTANVETIMNLTVVDEHLTDDLRRDFETLYAGHYAAGMFFVVMVAIASMSFLIFCIHTWRSDICLEKAVQKQIKNAQKQKQTAHHV